MTTIRITHGPGVGEWPCGAVVSVPDNQARTLADIKGYAERVSLGVAPTPRQIKKKERT